MGFAISGDVIVNITDDEGLIVASLSDVNTKLDAMEIDIADIDTEVDKLPVDPSSQSINNGRFANLDSAIANNHADVNAVKAKTDNLPAHPGNETTLQATMATIKSVVDAILIDTSTIPVNPATEATLAIINGKLDTLIANIEIVDDHLHPTETFVYPLTGTKTIEKVAASWGVYGAIVELIPANAIPKPFDLHFLNISSITANGSYHIGLYTGAVGAEVLAHEFPIVRTSVQSQEGPRNIITQRFAANTRISIALRGSPANVQSVDIIVTGHTY